MTSNATAAILAEHGSDMERAVLVLTALGTCGSLTLLFTRLRVKYVIPEAWRLTLALHDASVLLLALGLAFFLAYLASAISGLCSAAGFFFLFGLMDSAAMLSLVAVALLFLQNPGKPGQLSSFRKSWILVFVLPEKAVLFVLVLMPTTPIDYFEAASDVPVACFPVRQDGEKGAAYGAILFFILWVLLVLSLVLSGLCAFHLWKSNNSRIHASSPNLWQIEKIGQGRAMQKMLLMEQLLLLMVCFVVTVVVYTQKGDTVPPQWVVVVSLAVLPLVHVGVGGVQLVLWTSLCCCRRKETAKEPHQKLKKLELIRVEGPGKLRLRATWSAGGKGSSRRGLVKVYGPNHLKGWAQEIVVLGMLRKSQTASLLQCLWTSNVNPYFEAMTTLSGQIITSDARLICLELTSSGTLHDFLQALEVPLPEPCTRTILHDLAEGLACLHQQNILHRNLTSAAVYLKGSVQRLVLRASLGDFEEAQIYGSLQNGGITTTVSKKQFFVPDIRAYALVALEILGHVCQHRQKEKQPHRLVASIPDEKALGWEGSKSGSEGDHVEGVAARSGSSSLIHFCAPGALDDFKERSTRVVASSTLVMVGSAKAADDDARLVSKSRANRRDKQYQGWGEMHGSRSPNDPAFDGDLGQATLSPEDRAKLPEITHVKEAYHFEFPNQSVFHARGASENDYEEIQNIEEKLERGALYYAIARKREPARTGGYVVTRSPSGREIFLPANNNNGNHNHSRSSLVTSDSGYVGTTSSASSQQHHATAGPHDDEIDDLSEFSSAPKAAHRTTSANTISSFGDDILEVLPGMADDEDLRKGDRTRREIIRERGEARIEQIMDSYEERVRRGGLNGDGKDWPKLKFSRVMNGQATSAGNPRTQRTVTTPTTASTSPRYQQQASPRPKTAVAAGVKRIDKVRPLSASTLTSAAWNARNSFRKKKARTELSRALSKSRAFAKPIKDGGEKRGEGAKQVERKYASHNTAYVHDDVRDLVTIEDAAGAANSGKFVPVERNASNGEHSGQIRQPSKNEENVSSPQQSFNRELKTREQENRPLQPLRRHPQVNHVRGQNGSSFSSDDSFSSYCQVSGSSRDVSLTSRELTSASSQAGSPVQRGNDSNGGPLGDRNKDIMNGNVTAHTQEVILVPGMKFVDSGFDEDSVSVASNDDEEEEESGNEPLADDVSAEACTCSCGSEVTTGSDACTCTCSRCRGSIRGSHPPWSETQSSGSWSNSNSFSSYDVQMHRRKLSSRRSCHEEHVLGPDEQYPAAAKSQTRPQTTVTPANAADLRHHGRHHHYQHHHHHFHHHNHHNNSNDAHSQSGSACSKGSSISSSAALRRYRELTRKGVPLRVSVVDDGASKVGGARQGKPPSTCCEQREGGAERGEEDGGRVLDASLYQDLESRGFFDSTDSASSKNSPTHSRTLRRHPRTSEATSAKRLEVVQGGHVPYTRYSELLSLPLLEDIIREIPDETSCSGDESKTFISRPASDVCLKILRGSTEDALAGEPRVHETELIIDKLFSRAQPLGAKGSDIFVHPILGLDENALRELAASASEAHLSDEGPEKEDLHLALLQGTDLRHVRYVKALAEKVDLLTVHDLFPADPRTFDTLRWRLQHTGGFGSIGLKLLDIARACWVQESPPSTADIVDQLTDHVTETEL